MLDSPITELAKKLEAFETPRWAVEAILMREVMTKNVLDPCCGRGMMAELAHRAGYNVMACDIHNWGYAPMMWRGDFLDMDKMYLAYEGEWTCFMNPPFSKACEFVEKAFELGARKVVMFQRFAFFESRGRRSFWDKFPPSKIYVCGDRASCWRFDIPEEEQGAGTTTAHAWFVFDRDHKGSTIVERLYKS